MLLVGLVAAAALALFCQVVGWYVLINSAKFYWVLFYVLIIHGLLFVALAINAASLV